jgi:hypothetical protein
MPEIDTIIDGKEVTYSGLFRCDELYEVIREYFKERGYFHIERKNEESVLEGGKECAIILEPIKKFSDYGKAKIRVDMLMRDLKDKTVTVGGSKQQYQHGHVRIRFFAFLETDWRGRYDNQGWLFLFRTISNKFIRRDLWHSMEDMTRKDCEELADEIRSYLNMNRFKVEHGKSQAQEE